MADNVIMAEARGMSPRTGEQTMILVIQNALTLLKKKAFLHERPTTLVNCFSIGPICKI